MALVVVSNGAVSTQIDLATGVSVARPGEKHRRVRGEPSLALGGLRERVRETSSGPRTELLDPENDGVCLASVHGELLAGARSGSLVVLSVGCAGGRFDVVATVLGAGATELRLPGSYAACVAAEGAFAVAVTPGTLHAFRIDRTSLAGLSLAIPTASRSDLRLVRGEALVLAGQMLVTIELGALPFQAGAHRSIPMSYAAIVGSARGLREPGVVVATVGAKILVDHPEVKRITIERTMSDPPVKAGDRICVLDVREPLPGVLKVHAWTLVGATSASVRPPPPPLELPAPDVAPIAPSAEARTPRVRGNLAVLREYARGWPCSLPASIESFFAATDDDAVLERWLGRLGVDTVDVRDLSIDWSADPCLVAFGSRGNGDALALYLYPPALVTDEPIVVEYWHETNECTFVARTFDAWLERLLTEQGSEEPEVAAMIRSRLGLTPRSVDVGKPPAWLPVERAAPLPLAAIDALEKSGDLVRAERAWLTHYLTRRPNERAAHAALLRIYAQLGWTGPLAALKRASEDL